MKPSELFLQTLDAQLGDLPPERRAEILDETRAHLEAMLAARRADGIDEDAAWQSALAAFGDAEDVGRDLAREWKRGPRYETVGTPLSKSMKRRKIAGFLVPLLLAYPAISLLFSWLEPRHLVGPFFLAAAPLLLAFNVWRHHKKGLPFTAMTISGMAFSFLLITVLALKIQFASELQGTPLGNGFDTYFSPFVTIFCLMMLFWSKRQNKRVLPWRLGRLYRSNPIAAEEEHRLGLVLGMIASTAIPCFSLLWRRWQFFDVGYTLSFCCGIAAFNFLVWRWIR